MSALGFATQLRIGRLGAPQLAVPRDVAQIAFPYCVADTDDHVRILLNNADLGIVREIRNSKDATGSQCERPHFRGRGRRPRPIAPPCPRSDSRA
ncbi:conserved protein of unknown function [uncultured Sphingopyxis sp.]|uniref:Uncharacterized protein n=1 Tax=uncultured Sphingopyxis sp. TaxID=310581 RepID=A0A1Y5PN81_9SPHN|nr:conserved protein of unknown function [uncultured Sphingopyxis sp.]